MLVTSFCVIFITDVKMSDVWETVDNLTQYDINMLCEKDVM